MTICISWPMVVWGSHYFGYFHLHIHMEHAANCPFQVVNLSHPPDDRNLNNIPVCKKKNHEQVKYPYSGVGSSHSVFQGCAFFFVFFSLTGFNPHFLRGSKLCLFGRQGVFQERPPIWKDLGKVGTSMAQMFEEIPQEDSFIWGLNFTYNRMIPKPEFVSGMPPFFGLTQTAGV